MTWVIDIETCSRADLGAVGAWAYHHDPSTKLLVGCALCLETGERREWYQVADSPDLTGQVAVAHNCLFESAFFAAHHLPQPDHWEDTIDRCRANALPGALDQVSQRLGLGGKDAEGRRLMMALCKPHRGELREAGPEALALLAKYCWKDVEDTAYLYQNLHIQALHQPLLRVHTRLIQQGVRIDLDLVRQLLHSEARVRAEQVEASGVDAAVLRSPKQFRALLLEMGVDAPDCRKDTLEWLAADAEPEVVEVITARIGLCRIIGKKLARLLQMASDGWLRGHLAYHGAHTGRFAGRGVNLLNFCRGSGQQVNELLADLKAERPISEDGYSALVRACILPDPGHHFAIADYSQIEARVLLWWAGEYGWLSDFRKPGFDPYIKQAQTIYGPVEIDKSRRHVGKTIFLGAGYGLGSNGLAIQLEAQARKALRQGKQELASTIRSLDPVQAIEAYRNSVPLVAGSVTGSVYMGCPVRRGGLWKAVEAAAKQAIAGQEANVGAVTFYAGGPDLFIRLPSGRCLRYPEMQLLENRLSFRTPYGGRTETYGGKLTENCVQAMACDILVAALVECARRGYRTPVHVYDSILASGMSASELTEVMTTNPDWCPDLPLAVKAHEAERWTE